MPVIDITNLEEMGEGAEHQQCFAALTLSSLICVPFAIRAAIKLGVFEIIAAAGLDAYLSPANIASEIPNSNPDTAILLERVLRMLVTNSILRTSHRTRDGEGQKPHMMYDLGKLENTWCPDLLELPWCPC